MADHSKNFADSLLRDLDHEDGSFRLEQENERAMLSVFPPGPKGKPLDGGAVLSRIALFGIENADSATVASIIRSADGEKHDIGFWARKQPEDSAAELEISPDGMRATLSFSAPRFGGVAMTREKILHLLKLRGIKAGVKEEVLEQITGNPRYRHEYVIARGKLPSRPVHGTIRVLFREGGEKPHPLEKEDGRVDYRELGVISSVAEGTPIAEKTEPQYGEAGFNVYGEEIPPEPPKPAEWKNGANTAISRDGSRLTATITGRPVMDRFGVIRVDEVVDLENVDFSTGNVDFPGTIIVRGTMADGFRLSTNGSIILHNTVGRVFLKAGRDIELAGGFAGKNEGLIEADGDVHARFIENGKVLTKGNIYVREAAMHSVLIAEGSIVMNGGRGELIGGEAIAAGNVICETLGARMETKTRVLVGTPPEMVRQLESLRRELTEKEEVLEKLEISLNRLTEIIKNREMTGEEKEMHGKLIKARKKYRTLKESILEQLQLLQDGFQGNERAFLLAKKEILPGAEIVMGRGRIFRVQLRPLSGKHFIFTGEDGEIIAADTLPFEK